MCTVGVRLCVEGSQFCASLQHVCLYGGGVEVRHELGESLTRAGVRAIATLTHPEKSLLVFLLDIKLIFNSLEGWRH